MIYYSCRSLTDRVDYNNYPGRTGLTDDVRRAKLNSEIRGHISKIMERQSEAHYDINVIQVELKMAPLIFYTLESGASPPAAAVTMLADILGLKLEPRYVDLGSKEQKSEEFMKINPMGTVPVLQDGDFVVSESHAILRYLVEKYGGDKRELLYPSDVKTRAVIDQCMFFDAGVFFVRLKVVILPMLYDAVPYPTPKQLEDIETAYGVVEAYLSRHKYLAADHLTIADLSLATTAKAMRAILELDSKKFPRCAQWLARLEKEPWYPEVTSKSLAVLKYVMKTNSEKLANKK